MLTWYGFHCSIETLNDLGRRREGEKGRKDKEKRENCLVFNYKTSWTVAIAETRTNFTRIDLNI